MLTREQWLAALRSGDYAQAKGVLYSSDLDAYCCLGVACALAGAKKEDMDRLETSHFDDVGLNALWPALGLTEEDCDNLATANDGGVTFAQIADMIEGRPFKRVDLQGYIVGEQPPLEDEPPLTVE